MFCGLHTDKLGLAPEFRSAVYSEHAYKSCEWVKPRGLDVVALEHPALEPLGGCHYNGTSE